MSMLILITKSQTKHCRNDGSPWNPVISAILCLGLGDELDRHPGYLEVGDCPGTLCLCVPEAVIFSCGYKALEFRIGE